MKRLAFALLTLFIAGSNTLLYNVRKDLGERDDLTSRRQDVFLELMSKLAAWEKDVDAEAKANQAAPTKSR